jgi:hypothetical protein
LTQNSQNFLKVWIIYIIKLTKLLKIQQIWIKNICYVVPHNSKITNFVEIFKTVNIDKWIMFKTIHCLEHHKTITKVCTVNKSSVVSLLVTAQKQCLGKCRFNTQKCLFIFGDTQKCVFDTRKCLLFFNTKCV